MDPHEQEFTREFQAIDLNKKWDTEGTLTYALCEG
jgi:hypothetical protein